MTDLPPEPLRSCLALNWLIKPGEPVRWYMAVQWSNGKKWCDTWLPITEAEARRIATK